MTIFYRIAADCIVLCHMAYVMVVVLGLPAIWIGIALRQNWARNLWWRCGHLSMILIVVGESWAGITCPLTIWENQLRDMAQQETYQGAFFASLVHNWLFYEAPPWVFTVIYSTFGSLVFLTFVIFPPRWPWVRNPSIGKS